MEFKIQEYRTKLKSRNSILNFLSEYLLFPIVCIVFIIGTILFCMIILPILYLKDLFVKKNKIGKTENEFEIEFESGHLIIERKFVDYYVKEIEDLKLDVTINDYVFKLRTTPRIEEIEQLFFDMNFFETEIGFFFISINPIPNGMTLWFLNKNKIEFKKVRDLVSSDWDFKTEKDIESGKVYKKYKDRKLDSIVVGMVAVNYGNALIFSLEKDEIRITNAADKNSLITIGMKNGKQVRTFFYKNKPAIIIENINFDINNLPKNAQISNAYWKGTTVSSILTTNYQAFGDDNPDKTFKLFYRLNGRHDLTNLEAVFDDIGHFFDEEDALLKIFDGNYAEKFEAQALSYFKTDHLGKITDGINLEFDAKKPSDKTKYTIYKGGKAIKSGTSNVTEFQPIFIEYREKTMDNE